MKRQITLIFLPLLALMLSSCAGRGTASSDGDGVYYWRTTFSLSDEEKDFLAVHDIERLYLRLFDVVLEQNYMGDSLEVVPVATTRFESPVPEGVEIVPTVFITLEAMRHYASHEDDLARLITTRVLAMCSYHDLGDIREVQYDCDWTSGTEGAYRSLCESSMRILHEKGILLSGTIRLHQIGDAFYPFDRGVVMLYNTGAIKDVGTENSILSYDDVHRYLGVDRRVERFMKARRSNCGEVSLAYPLFSWSVVFRPDGSFHGLLRRDSYDDVPEVVKVRDGVYSLEDYCWVDDQFLPKGATIRVEHSDIEEILRVKALADATIGQKSSGNILYHLDSRTIDNYTDHEIEKILR